MRLYLATLMLLPVAAHAQGRALSTADGALVHAILTAEDRGDSASAALDRGVRHASERVRSLARRARWRIADSLFAARESLPAGAPATRWPENAWRQRYRAMLPYRDACDVVVLGLRDSTWQVRLRAADVVRAACASDERVVAALRAWLDSLPADVSRRTRDGVSWHSAAHALVALARLRPAEARQRMGALATHPQWHLRMYAARAAGLTGDTALLRALASDANDNVKEAAIENLSRVAGRAADSVYVAALSAEGAQAVRAAALALKGTSSRRALEALAAAQARWSARGSDSERDVIAALADAGAPPLRPRARAVPAQLPRDAVRLALGADVRLHVAMDSASGGGSFTVRLRGDIAPIMAARVLELARSGHYDGGTWWRVEHDFVIQGAAHGDNEYVGHSRYLRDELGNLAHPRGTVGMSTRGHDTGDAQWFVNMRDNPRLVRDFTVFAEVVEGMDVVDQIQEGDRILRVTILEAPGRRAEQNWRGRPSPAE